MSTLNVEFLKQENSSSNNVTLDSDGSVAINRHTSDGTIIDLQKDGTSVGSVGAKFSGRSYIASGISSNTGIRFDTNFIAPADAVGANRDAALNIGSSGSRFKDLYLSGGVYVGGTTSANFLDDYEEGTFTPTFSNQSVSTLYKAKYTKIGRQVMVWLNIIFGGSGNASALTITNLPFAAASGADEGVATGYTSHSSSVVALVGGGSTIGYFYNASGGSAINGSEMNNDGVELYFIYSV